MSEFKYTSDGKKVVVIGELNQTEKIVQEIFVTEKGDEIPQGERFVVKSLLDEPAKSWKEKDLLELESRYEKEKKEWDSKIESVINEKSVAYESLRSRVKWLRAIAKEPREEEFKKAINTIADFFTDSEKWVVVKNYSNWELEKFNEDGVNEFFERYERGYGRVRFDSMRLLSLFGKADGNLIYRINDYSDGIGSDKDVVFFKSKEEALAFIQSEFDKVKEYSESYLVTAKKFDLKLDIEKLNTYQEKQKESINKKIQEAESRIGVLKENLSKL